MATFLLEVGTEELPADFVESAIAQWQDKIQKSLSENFLTPEAIAVYGTPRRLAVLLQGLPEKQPDREEEIKGPPASTAFQDGKPTQAIEGFIRKQGVSLDDLEIRETAKGEFIFVQKKTPGKLAKEILGELSLKWITQLEGRRFMRWGDGELRFPRPIRWLVALLDQEILPLELVNGSVTIKSDRQSQGHRILSNKPVTFSQASDYLETLRSAFVEADPVVRQETIKNGVEQAGKSLGGEVEISPELLKEVTHLVEFPNIVIGKFDQEFLDLPQEVIKTVMVTHQRYFAVKKGKKLLPYFITISNGDPQKSDIIGAGNERVIRARLADAQFFYKADCDDHLECYLPELEDVTFQEDLGTMRDKVDRIMEIAQQIANQLNLSKKERTIIDSAAMLCKADLVTQMVYEFPELQGIMGQKYAIVSGENEAVANAIFEHYLPRNAEDILPPSLAGQVVGIADRLDTLVSIFGLGMIPTGSSDPFALRRAANAIINITWSANLGINLAQLLEQAAKDFVTAHSDNESPLSSLREFFMQRIHTLLQDELKIDYDLVNAVLGDHDLEYQERALQDLLDIRDRASFLQKIRQNGQLAVIYETVNRSTRLAVKGELDTQQFDPVNLVHQNLFEKPSEQAFYDALLKLVPITKKAKKERNYQLLVDALAEISTPVNRFFDGEDSVLVMTDNPQVQKNRLNLLGLLRNHARILADFGAIVN
jgi:glycyl-tRNA synthetase beta chain